MQLSRGVEWAVHCCTMLVSLPENRGLSVDALADFFEVPTAYLAKQLQALRRAGVVTSVRGQGGGYRLARPVDQISLWDIVVAVEGEKPIFRCMEIRQNGPCGMNPDDCTQPCQIARAFAEAESAWRSILSQTTLADLLCDVAQTASPRRLQQIGEWINANI